MDTATLHAAISEVCPVESVTVDDPDDRLQWHYVAKPEAVPEQIFSADNVILTIPIYPSVAISTSDWLARWTNQEYLLLERKRAADIAADRIGIAKNWDIVTSAPTIEFTRKKVKSLKDDLVPDVLTQARADEIFS